MAPNSVIFVVIIGIWAAYLGKYWLRRRDHLATARSMDRFSESIRVLGQGRAAPSTDVHRAPHRSYAVSPGGPMRPQVTVKRSVATDREPALDPRTLADRPAGRAVARVPRSVRGLLLLVALAAFVVSLPLVPLWSRFPAWGPVVLLADVVAAFLYLRAAVQADIAARRSAPERAEALPPVRRPTPWPAPAPAARPAAAAPVEEPAAQAAVAAREEQVFDDQTLAPAPAAAAAQRRAVAERRDPVPVEADDDIPATWDPRPVPTPTYAMKQRASQPAATAAQVPEPIELDADDDDVSFARSAVGS